MGGETTSFTNATTGDTTITVRGPTFLEKVDAIKTLLAVFGVWVGTVIAFYYSSENMKTAQQGMLTAYTTRERLISMKASDAMETPVIGVIPDTPVTEAIDIMDGTNLIKKEISKIVVMDHDMKPLGILYYWELLKAIPGSEKKLKEKAETLKKEAETIESNATTLESNAKTLRDDAKTLDDDAKKLKEEEAKTLEEEAETLRGDAKTKREEAEKMEDEISARAYPISNIMAQVFESWEKLGDRGNYVKAKVDTSLAMVKMGLEDNNVDYAIIVNELDACLGLLTKKRLLEKSMME
jgi:CBS domain-containing protein